MFENINIAAAAIAVAFGIACSYYDLFNKRNIPENLLWAFLGIAAVASFAINGQAGFLQGALQAAVIAAIGYVSYKTGQMGLADVFVLCSIALLIPFVSLTADWGYAAFSFAIPAVLLVFFAAVVSFSYIMAFYYFAKVGIAKKKSAGKFMGIEKRIAFAAGLALIFSVGFLFLSSYLGIDAGKAALASTFPCLLFFFAFFMPDIKDSMIEFVPVSKLELEDVVAVEKLDTALVQKFGIGRLIDEKNIAAIKKSRLKSVPVYTGMPPFLPFLLIGLLIVIFFNAQIAAMFLPHP